MFSVLLLSHQHHPAGPFHDVTEKESAILQKTHKNYIICKRVDLQIALKESGEIIKATVVATEWLKLTCGIINH